MNYIPLLINIFTFFYSFAYSNVAAIRNCPPVCDCETELNIVCKDLLEFPKNLSSRTQNLAIVCSDPVRDGIGQPLAHSGIITKFPTNGLSRIIDLREFQIWSCPIVKLQDGAFMGLKFLSKIEIYDSILEYLPGDALINSYNVRTLTIVKSKSLRSIDPIFLAGQTRLQRLELITVDLTGLQIYNSIQHLQKSLRHFIWNHNMALIDLPTKTFKKMSLVELDLQFNQMKNLNFLKFTRAKRIHLGNTRIHIHPLNFKNYTVFAEYTEYLDLSSMNMNTLQKSNLPYFKKLKTLILRYNQLEILAENILDNLPAIQMIDLRNNFITTLSETFNNRNFFKMLREQPDSYKFLLQGNRIHCNCEIKWLQRYQLSRTIACHKTRSLGGGTGGQVDSVDAKQLTCHPPDQVSIQILSGANKTILTNVHDYQLAMDEEIIFRCISESDPAPHLTWIYQDFELHRQAGSDRSTFINYIDLTINQQSVQTSELIFMCRAHNREGAITQ